MDYTYVSAQFSTMKKIEYFLNKKIQLNLEVYDHNLFYPGDYIKGGINISTLNFSDLEDCKQMKNYKIKTFLLSLNWYSAEKILEYKDTCIVRFAFNKLAYFGKYGLSMKAVNIEMVEIIPYNHE